MLKTEFINEIREMLGDETPAFLRALDEKPTLALRVNPLRPGAMDAAQEFIGDKVPWAENGYYIKDGARPGASLAHDLGAFYLQEASAMVSASVLRAQPGEKILDLCAAPGGKTTQIAAAMNGEGLLVSNEPVPNRAKVLAENLERMGVTNAIAVCAYPDQLAKKWPDFFDAILVDAPCSCEGMFRREPASRDEWQPGSPAGCAKRQAEILDEAAKMLRPGGRLVYSTCTFNRMENEGSIHDFLNRHPEFSPENFELDGIGRSECGMLRVWPHRVRGDGHFVARLRKSADAEAKAAKPMEKKKQKGGKPVVKAVKCVADESPEQLLMRLEKDICEIPAALKCGKLIRQADYVHILPQGAPDLDGIKTMKPGLCLMRVGRSHVQPMPALARACGKTAKRQIELTDEEAQRVKQGEKLTWENAEPGWTLLVWHKLPMQFMKNSKQ